MAYPAGSELKANDGTVELRPIYCSDIVDEACNLIRADYRRPLDYAAKLALADVRSKVQKRKKRHRGLIHALIGETWLYDMLVDWLKSEHGWEVECPIISRRKYDNGRLRKLGWAARVKVESDVGNAEIDCFPRYGDEWVIGEAKSGRDSYSNDTVNKRISRTQRVLQERPSFVIAVPKDHQIILDGSHGYIEDMGGRVLVFDATVQEMHAKADQLFSEWKPASADM
jgi:hypothetical protein